MIKTGDENYTVSGSADNAEAENARQVEIPHLGVPLGTCGTGVPGVV